MGVIECALGRTPSCSATSCLSSKAWTLWRASEGAFRKSLLQVRPWPFCSWLTVSPPHAAGVRPNNAITSRERQADALRMLATVQTGSAKNKVSHSPNGRAPEHPPSGVAAESGKGPRDKHEEEACLCGRSLSLAAEPPRLPPLDVIQCGLCCWLGVSLVINSHIPDEVQEAPLKIPYTYRRSWSFDEHHIRESSDVEMIQRMHRRGMELWPLGR